jgi:hypothetical protein
MKCKGPSHSGLGLFLRWVAFGWTSSSVQGSEFVFASRKLDLGAGGEVSSDDAVCPVCIFSSGGDPV